MFTFSTDWLTYLTLSPLAWILGSLLLYVAGSHLTLFLEHLSPSSTWLLAHLRRSLWGITGSMLLRLAYFVGIPYLALILGVVGPRNLGLTIGPDWGSSLSTGIKLGLAAMLAIAVSMGYYAYTTRDFARREQRGLTTETAKLQIRFGWSLVLIDIICQEAHWALYRAGPTLLLNDTYAGSLIGLVLVLLEIYANPRHRYALSQAGQAEYILLNIQCAVVSTVLYLFIGSLWACTIIHLGITVVMAALLGRVYDGWGTSFLRGWRPWRFYARAAADTHRRS